jgi:hypothetical protein
LCGYFQPKNSAISRLLQNQTLKPAAYKNKATPQDSSLTKYGSMKTSALTRSPRQ